MQMAACCSTTYACSSSSSCTDSTLQAAVTTCVQAGVSNGNCADAGIADWDVSAVTDMMGWPWW